MEKKRDTATHFSTLGVRAGQARSQFREHSEALFLTSSFVFDSAAQAQARFSGEEAGFVYSRYTNPTVAMLQDRLAALEGAEACVVISSRKPIRGQPVILTSSRCRSGVSIEPNAPRTCFCIRAVTSLRTRSRQGSEKAPWVYWSQKR